MVVEWLQRRQVHGLDGLMPFTALLPLMAAYCLRSIGYRLSGVACGVVWCGPRPRRCLLVLMLLPPSQPITAGYFSFGRLC